MVSIVQYFGDQTSKCGYCKGVNCSKSDGMHAYRLTCQDYQDLIDRGWRRSGNYCYKPQKTTCCPCYTIKCNALEFKLTKSNKRILKRMSRFLRDGKREQSPTAPALANAASGEDESTLVGAEQPPQLPDKVPEAIDVENVEQQLMQKAAITKSTDINTQPTKAANEPGPSSLASSDKSVSSNPPRKKAKQMRLERRLAKLGASAEPAKPVAASSVSQEKTLRDFLTAESENDKHKLKLRLVQVDGEEFKRTKSQSYALFKRYQISIHSDPPKNERAYLEFLQETPFKHEKPSNGPNMGFGSFHQQYWLDDKLIAVGVIDILPASVSSVYFFYDPDYSFLSLGTYGSLREIDLVQSLAEQVPALKYYYMGFYIHECPKMRYKGKLSASYLLCPETYVWLLLTDAIRSKLDEEKYQRLNPDSQTKDVNEFLPEHLNDVLLLIDAKNCTKYGNFVRLTGLDSGSDMIMEYGQLVGRICAHRMLYVYPE